MFILVTLKIYTETGKHSSLKYELLVVFIIFWLLCQVSLHSVVLLPSCIFLLHDTITNLTFLLGVA